ncbi:DUF2663 family protein [Massilibacterium senegalense]|uniref:DUF2663 family protein n=1 Tax=Massilibacterium senegalense TaxID=1632858 RepID=UPI000781CF81|nr:DUF2663 family protein [Massilibacterium senegalense]
MSPSITAILLEECIKRKRVMEKRRRSLRVVGTIVLFFLGLASFQLLQTVWTLRLFFDWFLLLGPLFVVFIFQTSLFQESQKKYEELCHYIREFSNDFFITKEEKEQVYHDLFVTYDINLYYS